MAPFRLVEGCKVEASRGALDLLPSRAAMSWLAHRPRTGWRSSPWGALLGLLLLLGTLPDIHPDGASHSLLEPLRASEYAPEAAHPGQPVHLEPGAVVSHPHCPVCLHRLQLGGLHLTAAADLVPPATRELLALPGDSRSVRGTFSPSGARGPPLS